MSATAHQRRRREADRAEAERILQGVELTQEQRRELETRIYVVRGAEYAREVVETQPKRKVRRPVAQDNVSTSQAKKAVRKVKRQE